MIACICALRIRKRHFFPFCILVLISFSSIFAKDLFVGKEKFPEQILRLEQMIQKQRKDLAQFEKKQEIYDSKEDPFFKDKEVESHTRVTKTSYLRKKKRQILLVEKEIDQLAPPSPTYTWYYEYYFDHDHLYAVCFQYYIQNREFSGDKNPEGTEILVFFPRGSKAIAYRKKNPSLNLQMRGQMQLDYLFVPFDYEEKDESGMTTAVLREGIHEILKEK